mmetsp:Transcript_18180/g.41685  ORF Transcript_18180/g.41685 Transcript_18180/m.41685 type:complete len:179 (-) Transcript_18180:1350-1886(-)
MDASTSATLREWLSLSGVTDDEVQSVVHTTLCELVKQRFDALRADTLLEADGCADLLERLVQHSMWRQMLCELREEHTDSRLLQALQLNTPAVCGVELNNSSAVGGSATTSCGAADQLAQFTAALGQQLHGVIHHEHGAQERLHTLCAASEVHMFCAHVILQSELFHESGYAASVVCA